LRKDSVDEMLHLKFARDRRAWVRWLFEESKHYVTFAYFTAAP